VPRYWNAFGIGLKSGSADIVAEINPPLEGVTGRVAGLFARDREGRRYLNHRGRIGGGRKGVGLSAFLEWYRGSCVKVSTANNYSFDALYVCCVDSSDAVQDLDRFVREVKQFKDEVRADYDSRAPSENFSQTLSYDPEFFGQRKGGARHVSDHFSWHGRVVDALADRLSCEYSSDKIFNTRAIDLGVHGPHEPEAVYEIKTSCSSQSVYTGIGQLFFHTAGLKTPRKILVLPRKELSPQVVKIIESTGVEVLGFSFSGNKVRFSG
jgi:hypothetical protein